MSRDFKVGYTTGTFDMTHEGHYNLLKHMRLRCEIVLVGLVTDQLASRQKRTPILSYHQRKCILDNCKYVDMVLPYNGRSKGKDHKYFHFNAVFIGDDYQDSKEYLELQQSGIPVICVPRTPGISTTQCLDTFNSRHVRYYPSSTTSCVYGILGYVYKAIRVGHPECTSTGDVYNIGLPFPRNNRVAGINSFPNIGGINALRELQIHKVLEHKEWYPVVDIQQIVANETQVSINGLERTAIDYLQLCRANPAAIYIMKSKHGGRTFRAYWKDAGKQVRRYLLCEIERIVNEMVNHGIVHGDLHTENICIQGNLSEPTRPHVSIIDFSWCQHSSFDMTDAERADYLQKLESVHDLSFFRASMREMDDT